MKRLGEFLAEELSKKVYNEIRMISYTMPRPDSEGKPKIGFCLLSNQDYDDLAAKLIEYYKTNYY